METNSLVRCKEFLLRVKKEKKVRSGTEIGDGNMECQDWEWGLIKSFKDHITHAQANQTPLRAYQS